MDTTLQSIVTSNVMVYNTGRVPLWQNILGAHVELSLCKLIIGSTYDITDFDFFKAQFSVKDADFIVSSS